MTKYMHGALLQMTGTNKSKKLENLGNKSQIFIQGRFRFDRFSGGEEVMFLCHNPIELQ
jgi:hypothetical protein